MRMDYSISKAIAGADLDVFLRDPDVPRIESLNEFLEREGINAFFVGSVLWQDQKYRDVDVVAPINLANNRHVSVLNFLRHETRLSFRGYDFQKINSPTDNPNVLSRSILVPNRNIREKLPFTVKPANIDLMLVKAYDPPANIPIFLGPLYS